MTGKEIREALLESIEELKSYGSGLQAGGVFQRAEKKLSMKHNDIINQQCMLTIWNDLFRIGYLAWGYNISNPNPPFFHITDRGRKALQHFSRDPSNPDGYKHYLTQAVQLNNVAMQYVVETLDTYGACCYKSAAVMVGCAAESMVFELRDALVDKMRHLSNSGPKGLNDWKIKTVANAMKVFFDSQKEAISRDLFERYKANWDPFIQQIRKVRNDAGHPSGMEQISEENVHASLLIFPELAKLVMDLKIWVQQIEEIEKK